MGVLVWKVILIYLACVVGRVDCVYSAAQETAIRTLIFTTNSYDYVSRPAAQTTIKVSLSLLAIDQLDLKDQSMKGAGWFTFEWDDTRLIWTPASYADIEDIFQEQNKIWKPELVVDNSIDEVGVLSDSNLYLRINYLGKIEWEPPQLLEVHCECDKITTVNLVLSDHPKDEYNAVYTTGGSLIQVADITYYPYDRQKCSVDVISWGYTVDEVNLEAASTSGINLEDFEDNGEWIVKKSSVELRNVTEVTSGVTKSYSQLRFYLFVQRRSSFYNLNVMIPAVCTSLLVVLVFVVPDESGEKLGYALTVFLSIAVILTLIADSMPPTSITVSVLGLYLAIVLIVSALAVVFTVGIMVLAKKQGYVKRPSALLVIARFAAKVTCHPFAMADNKVAPSAGDDDSDNVSERSIPCLDIEWKEVSEILDRFCFFIFLVVSIVMNISFIIALTVGGSLNEPE